MVSRQSFSEVEREKQLGSLLLLEAVVVSVSVDAATVAAEAKSTDLAKPMTRSIDAKSVTGGRRWVVHIFSGRDFSATAHSDGRRENR